MKLDFKKIVLFVSIICVFIAIIIGCVYRKNNNKHTEITSNVTETQEPSMVIDDINKYMGYDDCCVPFETIETTCSESTTEETDVTDSTTEPTVSETVAPPTTRPTTEPTTKPVTEANTEAATRPQTEPTTPPATEETVPETEPVAPETEPEEDEDESNLVSLGNFKLTAYCSCVKCCGEYALNRPVDEYGNQIVYGSIGVRLIAGVSIAVDPDVIPYYSSVIIDGNTYIAHDTGGAINGNRIDVYFDNHQDALNFGMRQAEVFKIVN